MKTDAQLKEDVLDELEWDPRVTHTDVGVTVKDGAVRLTGTVPSYPEKLAAERATKRVKGVRAIAEDIEVKLPAGGRATDADIAERIAHILEWSVSIPEDAVTAEVRNNHVTLTGEVEWNHQRDHVLRQIQAVRGVASVSNRIKIRSRTEQRDVKREIARALHRNADLEASNIAVDVVGGKVTLTGDVKAYYEKEVVANAVWAAPGVTEVVNNLRIA